MADPSEAGPSSPRRDTQQHRRLHVSGLNPAQCTVDDIKGRFSSFGLQVSDVDNWPPGKNAVGTTTDWCFVTVHGEEAAIKRATNILHNTMWKGHKLRIGKARPDRSRWGADGNSDVQGEAVKSSETRERDAQQAAKEKLKQERARRRRGIAGVEDAHVDSPVSAEDVKAGEWGWKMTPAGHLLRPMHMRPDRPVPRPTKQLVAPTLASEDGVEAATKEKGEKKRKSTNKPLARARYITIDPSRYHNAHLSGAMLVNNNLQEIPEGATWHYEDENQGSAPRWVLIGREGEMLQEDIVKSKKAGKANGSNSQSDESDFFANDIKDSAAFDDVDAAIDQALPGSDSEADALEDVDAAIDQASSATDSDDEAHSEPDRTMLDETFVTAPDMSLATMQYPHYDPAEEDEFSDGYQERTDGAEKVDGAVDFDAEKHNQMQILKSLFGADGVDPAHAPQSRPPVDMSMEAEESEEDYAGDRQDASGQHGEENLERETVAQHSSPAATKKQEIVSAPSSNTAASRREMLLGLLAPAAVQTSSQFRPIERYDPSAQQETAVVENAPEEAADQDAEIAIQNESPALDVQDKNEKMPTRADGHVQMTTLTDMFRPKESKGGFSLLDELDLDLDEDWAFDDAEEHADMQGIDSVADEPSAARPAAPTAAPTKGRPRMFPSTDEQGRLLASDTSIFGVVMQRLRESGVIEGNNITAFFQPEDAETLAKKWEHRKATLTQAYKRRHREALKKKRRKYVGARAAGTAAPAR